MQDHHTPGRPKSIPTSLGDNPPQNLNLCALANDLERLAAIIRWAASSIDRAELEAARKTCLGFFRRWVTRLEA